MLSYCIFHIFATDADTEVTDMKLIYLCVSVMYHFFLSVVRNMTAVVSHVGGNLWEAPFRYVVKGDITHNSTQTTMFFYQMVLPCTARGVHVTQALTNDSNKLL